MNFKNHSNVGGVSSVASIYYWKNQIISVALKKFQKYNLLEKGINQTKVMKSTKCLQ